MNTGASSKRPLLTFFELILALSTPLWVLGSIVKVEGLPLNVPVSVLGLIFVPLIAASILVYREEKLGGVKRLLKRAFDYERIRQKIWYVPIIFLPPLLFLLALRGNEPDRAPAPRRMEHFLSDDTGTFRCVPYLRYR